MLAVRSETTIEDACDALIEADRLTARALSIIGCVDCESAIGLPTEMMLVLGARRTGADARMLVNAAETLRAMPATASAFARGDLSWSQLRAIVNGVRTVDAAGRAQLDDLIATQTDRPAQMDPDELLARVDDLVARLRADLVRAREDRQIEAGFLAVQGRLDGSASFYGEADAASAATIIEALDTAAGQPVDPEIEGAPSRAQQHLSALVAICEQTLAGGSVGTTRPRPRLLATIDVESLRKGAESDGARILWSLAGRPAKITPLATDVLACDATVVPVLFDGARPVAVGDATAAITSAMRTALTARDRGCRFPGCRAPVSWCDAHHIRARISDGPTQIDNLVLLCRRCHRRVHRFRWRIEMRHDGTIEFNRTGHTYASSPQRPSRE
jgi:hypothetical protein